MGPFAATARATFSALLGPPSLLLCLGAVVAGWLLGLGAGGTTPAGAWLARGPLLVLALWLPGLWIAMRLRRAWPALGPMDEALAWVDRQGTAVLPPRLGAATAAALALLVLQGTTALGAGLVALTLPGRPPLRLCRSLRATPEVLAGPGNTASCALPSRARACTLRIEPRYYFSAAALRIPVRVEAELALAAGRKPVGSLVLHDFGAAAEIELPGGPAATLLLRRVDPEGPAFSLHEGRILLAGAAVSSVLGMALLAGQHLEWALLLLLLSLAASGLLAPAVHNLAVLGGAPLLVLLPGLAGAGAAGQLARGLLLAPALPGGVSGGLGLVLLVAGLLPPLRARTRRGKG